MFNIRESLTSASCVKKKNTRQLTKEMSTINTPKCSNDIVLIKMEHQGALFMTLRLAAYTAFQSSYLRVYKWSLTRQLPMKTARHLTRFVLSCTNKADKHVLILISFSDVIRQTKEACTYICDGTGHLSHALPSLSHRVIAMSESGLAVVLLAVTA